MGPKLFLGCALMVLVRTVIDALFIAYYFQVYSFTFVMPEQYQCDRAPCNNVVACYVDRPKQKTLVIYIMFATGCITVLGTRAMATFLSRRLNVFHSFSK